MNVLRVFTDLDGLGGQWGDAKNKKIIHIKDGVCIGRLKNGMVSGKSSVAIRIDLPDGETTLFAEVSMANFLNCARIFNGAEGNQ